MAISKEKLIAELDTPIEGDSVASFLRDGRQARRREGGTFVYAHYRQVGAAVAGARRAGQDVEHLSPRLGRGYLPRYLL